MKPIADNLRLLRRRLPAFPLVLLLGGALPVLLLSLLGALYLFERGAWGWFLLLLLLACLPLPWLRRRQAPAIPDWQPEPDGQWSAFEREIWQRALATGRERLAREPEWARLREHSLALFRQVAADYHPGGREAELAFTLPELLLLTEEVSRRYRRFLLEHVPYVEQLRLDRLHGLYRQRDRLRAAKRWYDAYRWLRLLTPEGWVAAGRDRILGELFEGMSEQLQLQLKQALLAEVAAVAIDLYGGRFRLAQRELPPDPRLAEDQQDLAPDPAPLRVLLVGQPNAGKSSLINALLGRTVAEVSALPSTERKRVYRYQLEGIPLLHLVDTPGIATPEAAEDWLVRQMADSDLVLWLLKANQSARQADLSLKQAFDAYLARPEQRGRRAPPLLALVNQVELLPPVSAPPGDPAKIATIREALDYNRTLLGADQALALSLAPGQPQQGLEELLERLAAAHDDAIQTQLARRRQGAQSPALKAQLARLRRLGRQMWGLYRDG
ncbi:GTPase family protein [Zobellella iuensis]|uniref:50S ribosome-binding GTPase n=1 Tax=Zobellella iuensis TaxID=2803811 RepID=A0ABS1QQX0_9GAMM|nr:GTPase [Zobellella iuensis]MBL1376649.1 50S ribosome-binding GTPase [Zobellella iuensis]